MATIDIATGLASGLQPAPTGRSQPYTVSVIVDYAKVLAAKGSALVATDVVQAIDIPANTIVMTGGIQQITAANSTTLTLHLGTTVDADAYVASFDAQASAANLYAQKPLAGSETVMGTAGTLDVTFATLTGTLTTGKVRVFAVLCDVASPIVPTLPALGS